MELKSAEMIEHYCCGGQGWAYYAPGRRRDTTLIGLCVEQTLQTPTLASHLPQQPI